MANLVDNSHVDERETMCVGPVYPNITLKESLSKANCTIFEMISRGLFTRDY